MNKLSVVLATYNEENNLKDCLESVKGISDEIVVVDGGSTDRTSEIAKGYGAKVIITTNPQIFHVNKQKALEAASNNWILQLDADERVTRKLGYEIIKIINMNNEDIGSYQENIKFKKLFLRHQRLIEERDGRVGDNKKKEYAGFFVPRLNYFLGKYIRYGGVYPDGVIRLVKKNQAHFPCKDVHEQIVIQGKVGWLKNDLVHYADPTFKRYLERNSKYIDLIAKELKKNNIKKGPKQFISYFIIKPIYWFFLTQIRHKGILDGWQGVVFSFFSALRFPRGYLRYLKYED